MGNKKQRNIRIAAIALSATLASGGFLFGVTGPVRDQWETEAAETIAGEWIQASDGRWWYKHSDGTYTTSGWEYIKGRWYYFDASGWMCVGWLNLNGRWFYLSDETVGIRVKGAMVTDWLKIQGIWYYFAPEKTGNFQMGQMMTGWRKLDGMWYYLNPSQTADAKEGQMMTGWLTLNGKRYYLSEGGAMQTGTMVLDGVKYTFAESGEVLTEEAVTASAGARLIADTALQYLDIPFAWEGTDLAAGCDNPGFVYGVLTACGYTVPQTVEGQQTMGTEVSVSQLQPGDVVVYETESLSAAIYLGENRVIYGASPRWGVRITTLEHPGKIVTCRRIVES